MLELKKNMIDTYLTTQIQENIKVDKVQKNEEINTGKEFKKNNKNINFTRKDRKVKKVFVVNAIAYKSDIEVDAEKNQIIEADNIKGTILDKKK